jgi:hypothetical protein
LERACFEFGLCAVKFNPSRAHFWFLTALLTILPAALADNGWEGQSVSLTWENDAIAQEDRHYTQGAKISYFSNDDSLPGWLQSLSDRIAGVGLELEAQKYGLALSQEIYTPEDLRSASLVRDDRPYAGWLFGSVALQRRGKVSPQWRAMETFRLDLGVIGPESLAEDTQKNWHGVDPKGWNHQLRTEPGLTLRYDRRYLFSDTTLQNTNWGYHVIPDLGGSLGNVATHLSAGAMLRLGYNIPNEFEAGPSRTPYRFGAYAFTGVEGRFVLHNIFLDGNTFRSSHSVEKKPMVGDLKVGITFVIKCVELTASHVFRTREFNDQKSSDSFGSATMTIKF